MLSNSYDRGVGIVPETRCANGRDRYGALCYNKCPGGYVRQDAGGSNFACVKSCPSGYRKTIQNICEIEKAQRNCRWACKGGWREVAGGQCRKNGTALLNAKTCYCPDKYNNMGANCQIDPKYQNITMPYAGGKAISGVIPILIRSSITAKVTESFKQECVTISAELIITAW